MQRREVSLDNVQIGAADSAGKQLEQNMAGSRFGPRYIFNR
jgi:hypothetical protein